MSNKEQTAIQWLQESISIHLTFEQQMQFEGLFQQAKEMEKKKIMHAFESGFSDGWNYIKYDQAKYKDSEEYYNEYCD